jgi:hypothetical protein
MRSAYVRPARYTDTHENESVLRNTRVKRAETYPLSRMVSSGMLRRVALVRTDVSEELSASFIRVTIGELGTTLVVTHAACVGF